MVSPFWGGGAPTVMVVFQKKSTNTPQVMLKKAIVSIYI